MAAWLQSHVLGTEVTCERCRHRWVFTQGNAPPPRGAFDEADVDRNRPHPPSDDAPDRRDARFEDDALDRHPARADDPALDPREDLDTRGAADEGHADASDDGHRDESPHGERSSLWDPDDRPPPRH